MRQFENLRKIDFFEKNRNLKWEYLPKKEAELIKLILAKLYHSRSIFYNIECFQISSFGL